MCKTFLIALATLFSVVAILGRAQEQKANGNPPQPLDCTSPEGADEKAVKAAQAAWAKHLDRNVEEELDLGGGVKMILVLIPPGKYNMGSPMKEKFRRDEEALHAVQITRPFYLGKYEVTQKQYTTLIGKNPSQFASTGANAEYKAKVKGLDTSSFPVEHVSWNNAVEFAGKLKKLAGDRWASAGLPTEAEWEYACRAGTVTPFHFGAKLNGQEANTHGDRPYGTDVKGPRLGRTTKVGSYPPNAFGLFDMHGNVPEWCLDYGVTYLNFVQRDPVQLQERFQGQDLKGRIVRGGGGGANGGTCWDARAAVRHWQKQDERGSDIGFRVCFRLPGASPALLAQANAEPAAPPWHISAVSKYGITPDAQRDKKGNLVFNGCEPMASIDEKGRLTVYSADSRSGMVREISSKGKSRFWDRFLWVTIRYGQNPPKELRDFAIRDEAGNKVGTFHGAHRIVLGKPLKEGLHMLVFERDRLPDNLPLKPIDMWKLVPGSPRDRAAKEWQSLKGLYLSGMNHETPLLAAKKGREKK
jgi:formylglycine-generating enzyme required for sulfatase activity